MTATLPAPWLQAYEPGVPTELPPAGRRFDGLLGAAAADAPGSPALELCLKRLSYAEIDARVSRAAAALQAHGLRPGDAIVIIMPNCPSGVVAALGGLRAGLVVALASTGMDRAAARRLGARLAPRLAIVAPKLAPDLVELLAPNGATVIVADPAADLPISLRLIRGLARAGRGRTRRASDGKDWGARQRAAPAEPEPVEVDPDAPALLFATEDGVDEGVVHTHRQLVAGALQVRLWLADAIPVDDTWLLLAPLASAFGFVVGLGAALLLRDRLVLLPAWTPGDVEDALRCLRPSYVVADGRTVARLVADPALSRLDPRSVRAWISGADLEAECVSAFEAATKISLCLGYAAPGVAGLATCNPVNGRRLAGSIGLPLPGVAARLAPAGGSSGRLELAGPNIAATDWLATGRPARIDASGHIYLEAGRTRRPEPGGLGRPT